MEWRAQCSDSVKCHRVSASETGEGERSSQFSRMRCQWREKGANDWTWQIGFPVTSLLATFTHRQVWTRRRPINEEATRQDTAKRVKEDSVEGEWGDKDKIPDKHTDDDDINRTGKMLTLANVGLRRTNLPALFVCLTDRLQSQFPRWADLISMDQIQWDIKHLATVFTDLTFITERDNAAIQYPGSVAAKTLYTTI